MLGIFVVFGYFLLLPQYLQLVLGLSPLKAGLWTAPSMGAFIVGSTLAPRMTRRVRPAFVMAAGLVLAALALGVLAQIGGSSGLAVLVTVIFVASLGLAPLFTLTIDLIIGAAPPERAGAASGISETTAELGGALGIAILGSVGTAVYRSRLADALPPGVPPEAAGIARDTLGGALAVAGQLRGQLGVGLLDAAREAFTQALQLNAAISAVVAAGLAIGAAVLLRRVRGGGESEQPPDLEPEGAVAGSVGVERVLGPAAEPAKR
jgi:DHA2 family multidrug resistance protein-like MFS transporter